MKKIFFALAALALSLQLVNAQDFGQEVYVKSPDAAKKGLDKALAASKDPKKAAKVATWMALGKAYMDAQDASVGNIAVNVNEAMLSYAMKGEKAASESLVNLRGDSFKKYEFAAKNVYVDGNGTIKLIEVTKPVAEDALVKAVEAYKKAYEVDLKHSKEKDIVKALNDLKGRLSDAAFDRYMLSDNAGASYLFEQASAAIEGAPINGLDSLSVLYAGTMAHSDNNIARAESLFKKCIANNYYGEDGEVFARLAEIYMNDNREDEGVEILKSGFTKFPESQNILLNLINYYLKNGKNYDELFDLLAKAKKNDPQNASLYSVEGDLHLRNNDCESAVKSYKEALQINPKYISGLYGLANTYVQLAINLEEKFEKEPGSMSDDDFDKLHLEYLLNAIDANKKGYESSDDVEIQKAFLYEVKRLYFVIRNVKPEYMAEYEKYNEIYKAL